MMPCTQSTPADRAQPLRTLASAGLWLVIGWLTGAASIAVGQSAGDGSTGREPRRPIALCRIGGRLVVGCRDSGTVCVVNPDTNQVLREVPVAWQLADVVTLDEQRVLAVDAKQHSIVVVDIDAALSNGVTAFASTQRSHAPWIIAARRVSRYPVRATVSPDKQTVAVASLWSHRVTILPATDLSNPVPAGSESADAPPSIDLSFAPRELLFLDDRHLLVAAAFGPELAIVDCREQCVIRELRIMGHNIGGLALTPDARQVVLSHQILNTPASTTRSIISWGGVISNSLQSIDIADLLEPRLNGDSGRSGKRVPGRLYPLGQEKSAAGDPTRIVVDDDFRTIVCLSGVSEVAVRPAASQRLDRVPVGQRPTSLLIDADRGLIHVACTFQDTVEVLDRRTLDHVGTIDLSPLNDPVGGSKTEAQRGEELFFDARLSLAGWFSCHSCHTDGHSTGLLNDNFGDNSFSTPKRILSLLGSGSTGPWAWNGSQPDLPAQIAKSIDLTMAGPSAEHGPLRPDEKSALAAYVRSLPAAPGLLAAREELTRPSIQRGRRLFETLDCRRCHAPPHYTSPDSYDVGLADEAGLRRFNPPSLLGVSQRGPWLHDNRAQSLSEIFQVQHHGDTSGLTADEVADLVDFLSSL